MTARQWQAVLDRLSEQVSEQSFKTWFSRIEVLSLDTERVELGLPNRFFREWLEDHYMPAIRRAVAEVVGAEPEIKLTVSGKAFREMRREQEEELKDAAPPAPKAGTTLALHRDYTLEEFVVGPSNRLAHAACVAVVENPAEAYNPLFLYSGTGLGKTHLLQGICREARRLRPQSAVVYVSCEEFVNGYINAIRSQRIDEFRDRYRRLDFLAIDDVHFLGAKEKTQQEFLHTFDALHNLGKQVVLSSDAHAREIGALQKKLVSRFVSGLVARIAPPEFETRVAILRRKAEKRRLRLSDHLCAEIARQVNTNVKELEGALAKVAAVSSIEGRDPDAALVRYVLRELATSHDGPVTLDEVLRAVVAEFGVKAPDIRSRKRTRKVLKPRQVAMYVARHATDHSTSEIGSYLGGRDHATVVHAGKRVKSELAKDPALRRAVENIFRALGRPAPEA